MTEEKRIITTGFDIEKTDAQREREHLIAEREKATAERKAKEIEQYVAIDAQQIVGLIACNMPTATPEEIVERAMAVSRLMDAKLREAGVPRFIQMTGMAPPQQGIAGR